MLESSTNVVGIALELSKYEEGKAGVPAGGSEVGVIGTPSDGNTDDEP